MSLAKGIVVDGPGLTRHDLRCVTIFFGALCGIGYSEGADPALVPVDSVKHSTSTEPQRFTPDLEDKLREMKKLENEWAAKRRTAKDVSALPIGISELPDIV